MSVMLRVFRTTGNHSKCLPIAMLAVCCVFNGGARADIYCSGTISEVLMYASGSVLILSSWRGDWTEICNTQGSFGGIDGASCLAWYGAAVKAAASQMQAGVYYSGNAYTCANLPTYDSSLVPVYFRTP